MVAVIVAEKPSAARNMASALGGQKGTYQGQAYEIVPLRGHLYEFVKPQDMVAGSLSSQYKSWDLGNLPWSPGDFNWKRTPQKDVADAIKKVKDAVSRADLVICATDLDPSGEGDLLFWEVIDELGFHNKTFARMEFTDESAASIQKAFVNRRSITSMQDEPDYRKSLYRTKWDYLSMQFTRVASKIAEQSGQSTLLRQGRLKSAMVKLVGDQLKAYNDYVKKPFFQNRFRDDHGVVYTNPEEPQFTKKDQVRQTYQASSVTLDSKETKRTAPPKLLDLAALSSLLVSKGINSKTVLATYQKMYEAQIVSYPRTEDKTITPEQFKELSPLIDQIAGVVGVDTSLLTHRQPRNTHVKPKGAHGANRPGLKVPTSLASLSSYGPGAAEIYEALAKNYLATIAEDYVYEQQKGHVTDYPDFRGVANVPTSAGWRAVFDPDAEDKAAAGAAQQSGDSDEPSENALGLGSTAEPFIFEGANTRPPHPTMRWLMKQLEKRDVGTGATRTSTYADVTSTKDPSALLKEKGTKVMLTEAGEMSWLLLPGTHIGDLTLTEKVYADMRAVAEGTAKTDDLLEQVAGWVTDDIATMQKNAETMRATLGLTATAVVQKERAEGLFVPTGETVKFAREWSGHRFTDEEVDRLLKGETIDFSATGKSGKDFDVFGSLAKQSYEGRSYFGFKMAGFGRRDASGNALPPTSWCKHVFTQAEIDALVAGDSIEATDFVNSKGVTFGAKLFFREETPGQGKKIVPDFGSAPSSNEPPLSWCQKKFTEAQRKKLAAGETISVKGFTSKKGTKFNAAIRWAEENGKKKIIPTFE